MLLVTKWFGVFLIEEGKVAHKLLFPKEPMEIANRMAIIQEGGLVQEEKRIASKTDKVEVSEGRLSALGALVSDAKENIEPSDYGYDDALLKQATIVLGKMRLKEVSEDQDIVHAIRAVEDLNQTFNLLLERLREWYIVHFPSVGPKARDEELIDLIENSEEGMQDVKALRSFTNIASQVSKKKAELEVFIEKKMETTSPNVTFLIGPVVGAKLIAEAGSLERLGRMPSSTVQVLGAEKALFKHLKDGTDPPKHGILFQHPLIHNSPYNQRGKIARALAGKVAIAARIDSTTKNFRADELKQKLDARIREIRASNKASKKRRK